MEKEELKKKVMLSLEKVRPFLIADGGDISLIDVTEDGIVKVRLEGACGSCPYSLMTLKSGVEQAIKKDVPEIKEVVSV